LLFLDIPCRWRRALKKLREESGDEISQLILVGLEKEYFGMKALFKNFRVYSFGMFMLVSAIGYGAFVEVYKYLN
jgi:hypothetical protein